MPAIFWLTSPGGPRARDPKELAACLKDGACDVEPRLEVALDQALDHSSRTLVVCGSIVLVGQARRLLYRRFAVPEPAIAMATNSMPAAMPLRAEIVRSGQAM